MKRKLFLFLVIITLAIPTLAQHRYPVAVTHSGILLGKYKTTGPDESRSTNPLPDTISVKQAKEIFALNGILINREKHIEKLDIAEFQLTIFSEIDSISIINETGILSPEAKNIINNISSGSKLIFEGINAIHPNGDKTMLILLTFTVK